jgi:hypothetical protein
MASNGRGVRPADGDTTYARLLRKGDRFYRSGDRLTVADAPVMNGEHVVVPIVNSHALWLGRDTRVYLKRRVR